MVVWLGSRGEDRGTAAFNRFPSSNLPPKRGENGRNEGRDREWRARHRAVNRTLFARKITISKSWFEDECSLHPEKTLKRKKEGGKEILYISFLSQTCLRLFFFRQK